MGDSRRERDGFSLKWEILEEKTRVFCFKEGFRRVNVIFVLMGIGEKKTRDFQFKWRFLEEKTHDFCLNGGFSKRKHVILA